MKYNKIKWPLCKNELPTNHPDTQGGKANVVKDNQMYRMFPNLKKVWSGWLGLNKDAVAMSEWRSMLTKEWGTVCDNLWNIKNAAGVCQWFGFLNTLKAAMNSELRVMQDLEILLDIVQCKCSLYLTAIMLVWGAIILPTTKTPE